MKERLTKAIIAKLEDEIDISESLTDIANDEDAIPLEDFLKARKDDFVWWRDVKRTDV